MKNISESLPKDQSDFTNKALQKKKRGSKVGNEELTFSSSVKLEKFIYEMLRTKVDNFKKSPGIKIENKNTKDPNVIKLEIKSTNKNYLETVFDELNVTQSYLTLRINEKDSFLTSDTDEDSLKSYISLFKIISYRIFKLDEQSVSLQLIGNEEAVEMVANLIEEYIQSKENLKSKEKEYEDLKEKVVN